MLRGATWGSIGTYSPKSSFIAVGDADRGADAQRRADQSGEHGVARAFGDELLDELAALGADRPRHAHLGAALGGEHREDQDDQQDAGRDREEAEDQEDAGEDARRSARRRRRRQRLIASTPRPVPVEGRAGGHH